MTTTQISIPAHHIEAALRAVSKDETRYYLAGVFIDARGFIAATNGHVAFLAICDEARKVSEDTSKLPEGIIVPSDALTLAIKASGRAAGVYVVFERDEQGQWRILYGPASIAFTPIDGTFPDIRRILPEAPETLTAAHYDPVYIAMLGKMAAAVNGGKKGLASSFRLHQAGLAPALVTFRDQGDRVVDDCAAVIMPLRTKPSDYATPAHVSAFRY